MSVWWRCWVWPSGLTAQDKSPYNSPPTENPDEAMCFSAKWSNFQKFTKIPKIWILRTKLHKFLLRVPYFITTCISNLKTIWQFCKFGKTIKIWKNLPKQIFERTLQVTEARSTLYHSTSFQKNPTKLQGRDSIWDYILEHWKNCRIWKSETILSIILNNLTLPIMMPN